MKSPLILRIFKGGQLQEVKQFEQDQVIIGNEGDVHVDLNDPVVSSIHCLIELRDSGYYICDLGSTTGTFKNGKQILDEPISSGEAIEIGPFKIQFFVGIPKPKGAPGATPASAGPRSVTTPPPTARASETVTHTLPPVPSSRPSKVNTPPPPKLPEAAKLESVKPAHKLGDKSDKNARKHAGTFAPPSEIKDLPGYFKSTKGATVEVVVSWKERVLEVYHFNGSGPRTIGSAPDADVYLPTQFMAGKLLFLDMTGGCRISASAEMNPYLVLPTGTKSSLEDLMRTGKAARTAAGHSLRLDQGEMAVLSIAGGTIQVFVRWTPQTRPPILITPLSLSSSEITALIASLVVVVLLQVYFSLYTPPAAEEKKEDQIRMAKFVYNKPPSPVTTTQPPPPTPTTVAAPPTTQPPKKVVVADKPQAVEKKPVQEVKKEAKAQAKASEVMAKPTKVDRPKTFTSVKQGGAVALSKTAGANAEAPKPKDVTKVGMLSAFGGGGLKKSLDQTYSGSGTLLGMANEATGKSGQNENRDGDDLGSKFKDTGAGGKGTATQGISGVGTKGKGGGDQSYGTGTGLGGKGNVNIEPGGNEEAFVGTIDKEAVRRVIKSIISQIKSCYERELRTNSSLEGKIVIQFEIVDQGRVTVAKTKSTTMNNAQVESCVALKIKDAKFPEPPPGTVAVVDFPFVFGAQR